jgi:ABC-2 type transport system ATP-binding protein
MLFIDNGKIVHHGAAQALKRGAEDRILLDIRVRGELAALETALALEDGVRVLEGIRDGLRVEVLMATPERLSQLLKTLLAAGVAVFDFHEHERRLEDAFIEMLSKGKKNAD